MKLRREAWGAHAESLRLRQNWHTIAPPAGSRDQKSKRIHRPAIVTTEPSAPTAGIGLAAVAAIPETGRGLPVPNPAGRWSSLEASWLTRTVLHRAQRQASRARLSRILRLWRRSSKNRRVRRISAQILKRNNGRLWAGLDDPRPLHTRRRHRSSSLPPCAAADLDRLAAATKSARSTTYRCRWPAEILPNEVAILVELYRRRAELEEVNRALAEGRAELLGNARALQSREAGSAANSIRNRAAIFELPGTLTAILEAQRDERGVVRDLDLPKRERRRAEGIWIARATRSSGIASLRSPRRPRAEHGMDVSWRASCKAGSRFATRLTGVAPTFSSPSFPHWAGSACQLRRRVSLSARTPRQHCVVVSGVTRPWSSAPVAVSLQRDEWPFEYRQSGVRPAGLYGRRLCARTWRLTHPEDIAADRSLADGVLARDFTLHPRHYAQGWPDCLGESVRGGVRRSHGPCCKVSPWSWTLRTPQILSKPSRERAALAFGKARSPPRHARFRHPKRKHSVGWTRARVDGYPASGICLRRFHAGRTSAIVRLCTRQSEQAMDLRGDGRFFACIAWSVASTVWRSGWRRPDRLRRGQAGSQARRQCRTDRTLASERPGRALLRFRELANNIDQFAWTCSELGLATWATTAGTTTRERRSSRCRAMAGGQSSIRSILLASQAT